MFLSSFRNMLWRGRTRSITIGDSETWMKPKLKSFHNRREYFSNLNEVKTKELLTVGDFPATERRLWRLPSASTTSSSSSSSSTFSRAACTPTPPDCPRPPLLPLPPLLPRPPAKRKDKNRAYIKQYLGSSKMAPQTTTNNNKQQQLPTNNNKNGAHMPKSPQKWFRQDLGLLIFPKVLKHNLKALSLTSACRWRFQVELIIHVITTQLFALAIGGISRPWLWQNLHVYWNYSFLRWTYQSNNSLMGFGIDDIV